MLRTALVEPLSGYNLDLMDEGKGGDSIAANHDNAGADVRIVSERNRRYNGRRSRGLHTMQAEWTK